MSLTDVDAARIGQSLIQARHAIDDALRLVQPALEVQRDSAPEPQVAPLDSRCRHADAKETRGFGGASTWYCAACGASWTGTHS